MKSHLTCQSCLLRQAQEAIGLVTMDADFRQEALRQAREVIAQLDWSLPPPALGQRVHRFLRHLTSTADPYASVKQRMNRRADELYPTWHRRFQEAGPPLEAAVRLAIVGNLLDVGAKTQLSDDAVLAAFEDALTAPLRGSVDELSEAIRHARTILYLADNAGEIVFDRDLLSQLPPGKFTLVVRGSPVLNDATLADAEWAGLGAFCDVLPNGSDAPGTILEDCSPAFRERFEAADLILAKGQGNYESLAGTNQRVFFLLKVKCVVLAEALHCPVGSLVLHHQRLVNAGSIQEPPARIL